MCKICVKQNFLRKKNFSFEKYVGLGIFQNTNSQILKKTTFSKVLFVYHALLHVQLF